MSSAGKDRGWIRHSTAMAVMSFFVLFSAPVGAQTAPAYSDVPPPSASPLSETATATPDTPDNYVGEGPADSTPLSGEDVMRMLRTGNNSKPLSIADLAAINDSMKRMDYMLQIQRKMTEAGVGTDGLAATDGRGRPAAPRAPSSLAGASSDSFVVLRVSGAGGRYQALVSNGKSQTILRVGDKIGEDQVTSITLAGVQITAEGVLTTLPFAAPASQLSAGLSRR